MAANVVPASYRAGADPSSTSTLIKASAICIAASVYDPTPLSSYAGFAASIACFAHAVWPDGVDAVLGVGPLDAYVRRKVMLARADLRRLGDAAAPVYAAAGARRWAAAKWSKHKDAAGAAWLVLCLVGRVARLAATALFDAAYEEAKAQAPSVLAYLQRGMIDGIRSPSGKTGEEDAAASSSSSGFVFRDILSLLGMGFCLLFSMHLFFNYATASRMQICAACLAATCGLTLLTPAGCIGPPDDDPAASDDRPDGEAAASEASRDAELQVRGSWRFVWFLILIAYCAEAFFLRVALGPHPIALAILALSNFKVLNLGRQVQLTRPDDGEGAELEGAAESIGGAVNKWRRGALVVLAASSIRIVVIYLAIDCYLAALSFLWLCAMADFLRFEEDSLSDLVTTGDDDEAGEQGGEEADEAMSENGETSSCSSEDEEERCVEEHCHSSEEDENGGGGTDDDGWELAYEHSETSSSVDEGRGGLVDSQIWHVLWRLWVIYTLGVLRCYESGSEGRV